MTISFIYSYITVTVTCVLLSHELVLQLLPQLEFYIFYITEVKSRFYFFEQGPVVKFTNTQGT